MSESMMVGVDLVLLYREALVVRVDRGDLDQVVQVLDPVDRVELV